MVATAERLYEIITDEDPEADVCEAISEDACREAPGNHLLNAANGSTTKLAEQIASPGLVLSWLLGVLGAPVFLVGLLEPVRQGGALLPQLTVAGRIRAYHRRKWFWVAAGSVQALSLIAMLVAVASLAGIAAGALIVAALAVFSVASGVGSVAFREVMGKTIPKGRRGQLLGLRSSIGGGLTIAAGLALYAFVAGTGEVAPFLVLLGAAAALWALGAVLFAFIGEEAGATGGSRNTLDEARNGMGLVSSVPGFRKFLLARAFLLSAELSVPFYTLRARELTGEGEGLGLFIVTLGLAALIGSPFWGRLSDRRSHRLVLAASGTTGAVAAALALLLGLSTDGVSPFIFAPVFLLAGLAQAGVRVGRKSYLTDAAPSDERPLYTAVSNTSIGILTLAFGALGVVAQAFGVGALIFILLALGLAGAGAALYMPEAGRMVG